MSKREAVVSYRDQKSLFLFVRFTSMMMIVDVKIHDRKLFAFVFSHDAVMQRNAGRRLKTITPLIVDLFVFLNACFIYANI